MILMESATSRPPRGDAYPLALGIGVNESLVEKVPRDPSGNDRVEISMGEIAVVALD